MSVLLELATRCEAASGPDRELDADIWLCVTPGATRGPLVVAATEMRRGWTIDEASGRMIVVPAYTASLDAAASLIPEGCVWNAMIDFGLPGRARVWDGDRLKVHQCDGETPALALCAAALRAQAAL